MGDYGPMGNVVKPVSLQNPQTGACLLRGMGDKRTVCGEPRMHAIRRL
jgi:hypothetical protein